MDKMRQYPSSFGNAYLRPEIRLEIGPLAQWVPNAEYSVSSYVAELCRHAGNDFRSLPGF